MKQPQIIILMVVLGIAAVVHTYVSMQKPKEHQFAHENFLPPISEYVRDYNDDPKYPTFHLDLVDGRVELTRLAPPLDGIREKAIMSAAFIKTNYNDLRRWGFILPNVDLVDDSNKNHASTVYLPPLWKTSGYIDEIRGMALVAFIDSLDIVRMTSNLVFLFSPVMVITEFINPMPVLPPFHRINLPIPSEEDYYEQMRLDLTVEVLLRQYKSLASQPLRNKQEICSAWLDMKRANDELVEFIFYRFSEEYLNEATVRDLPSRPVGCV